MGGRGFPHIPGSSLLPIINKILLIFAIYGDHKNKKNKLANQRAETNGTNTKDVYLPVTIHSTK